MMRAVSMPSGTKTSPTTRQPTLKQRRFAKELILKDKSPYRAGQDAGYSENTATNARIDILEKPGTQIAIKELKSKVRGDFTALEQVQAIQETLDNPSTSEQLKIQIRMKIYELCKKDPSHNAVNDILDAEHEELQALIANNCS